MNDVRLSGHKSQSDRQASNAKNANNHSEANRLKKAG